VLPSREETEAASAEMALRISRKQFHWTRSAAGGVRGLRWCGETLRNPTITFSCTRMEKRRPGGMGSVAARASAHSNRAGLV